jgi:hypothetical protein
LEDRLVPSTLTVTNTDDKVPGSLRDAITHAQSGDTIVFAASLDGQTITLTSDQLTLNNSLNIEGPGANLLTISGNAQNRIFDLNEGLNVTINDLTLTQGRAVGGSDKGGAGHGGAILNVGSVVSLANDVFSDNVSIGSSGQQPQGGAIANFKRGSLTVANCAFLDNRADGVKDSSKSFVPWAEGGAIYGNPNFPSITVTNCSFIGNQAIGGDGGVLNSSNVGIGTASGGAIHVEGPASTLTVIDSTFTGNEAIAGSGGSAPNGDRFGLYAIDATDGGAIVCHDGANLIVRGSTFTNNDSIGGSNASGASIGIGFLGGGFGGAVHCQGPTTITDSTFIGNEAIGGNNNSAGSGTILVGGGYGGAIYHDGSASPMTVSNSTFTNNQAVGGTGNTGGVLAGDGVGGGIVIFPLGQGAVLTATVSSSTFSGNQAIGGAGSVGSNGADGLGGAMANILGATLTASNCTLSGNQAVGGAGGSGANGGNGFGGGLYNDGSSTFTVTGSTVTANSATAGAAGSGGSAGQGVGGGAYFATGGIVCLDVFTVANIIGNTASTSNNDVFGVFTIC